MSIRRPGAEGLRDFAFFAVFLVYVWVGIDTRLIYHWQGVVFSTIPGFFGDFLKYPGGPVEYLYALIAQANTSPAWGAVAITAQVAAVTALTSAYFATISGKTIPILRFVPALALLYFTNLYYDRMPLVLAVIAGLGFSLGFAHLARRWRSDTALLAIFLAMAAAAYYLAGMAVVFLALTATAVRFARKPRRFLAPAYLFVAAALPAGVELLRLAHMTSSAREWFIHPDLRRTGACWALYVFYLAGSALVLMRRPAALAVGAAAQSGGAVPGAAEAPVHAGPSGPRAKLHSASQKTGGRPPKLKGKARPMGAGWMRRLIPAGITLGVLAALGAVAAVSYRASAHVRLLEAVDYNFTAQNWQAVLDAAPRLDTRDFNPLTCYEINLALHETNRLGDEMFHYPQTGSMLLGLREYSNLSIMVKLTDMCLRLGRVNEAERYGNDALVLGRSDAAFYRVMARMNMVKGQTVVARKYLNVLSFYWGSGSWAHERLDELDRDPQLAQDAEIQLLRRRMQRTEDMNPVWQSGGTLTADMKRLLFDQLEQDPTNRMAFEFLLGTHLLARNLDAAIALMPRIAAMWGPAYIAPDGRRRTPKHYQEAVALYAGFTHKMPEIEGLVIDPDTTQRMQEFSRIMVQFRDNKEGAMQAAWSFRDSYFFYYAFGPGDYR